MPISFSPWWLPWGTQHSCRHEFRQKICDQILRQAHNNSAGAGATWQQHGVPLSRSLKILSSRFIGDNGFFSCNLMSFTWASRSVSSSIGMETSHTLRLLAVMWSKANFIFSLMDFLRNPTFLSPLILTENMRVESSPSTQQFSRSRGDLTTTWSASLSRSLKISSSPFNDDNGFFLCNPRSLTWASRSMSSSISMETSHTLRLLAVMWSNAGFVTNFPFSVHYLRLMLDLHAFACFVLFSNVPFPYVDGMYFIHAYSSCPPYSLHAFYLMYITRLPRLHLIPS